MFYYIVGLNLKSNRIEFFSFLLKEERVSSFCLILTDFMGIT